MGRFVSNYGILIYSLPLGEKNGKKVDALGGMI